MADQTTVHVARKAKSVEFFGLVFDDGEPYVFDDGELYECEEVVS